MDTQIVVENLSKRYSEGKNDRVVLKDLALQVFRGEFAALMGRSGTGKSTLLHLLCGIDLPDSGDITIDGQAINRLSEHNRTLFRRKNIGLVFQFFNLIDTLTVEENLLLPLRLNHVEPDKANKRIERFLTRVDLLDRKTSFPEHLSGGEQQRIAVGRALLHKPSLLLADEPTGNLDTSNAQVVLNLLRELANEQNVTVIVATHSSDVLRTSDRVLQLESGKLIS